MYIVDDVNKGHVVYDVNKVLSLVPYVHHKPYNSIWFCESLLAICPNPGVIGHSLFLLPRRTQISTIA